MLNRVYNALARTESTSAKPPRDPTVAGGWQGTFIPCPQFSSPTRELVGILCPCSHLSGH